MTEEARVPTLSAGEYSGSCRSGVDICDSASEASEIGVCGLTSVPLTSRDMGRAEAGGGNGTGLSTSSGVAGGKEEKVAGGPDRNAADGGSDKSSSPLMESPRRVRS